MTAVVPAASTRAAKEAIALLLSGRECVTEL